MNRVIDALAIDGASSAILSWVGQALILGTLLAGLTWLVVRVLRRRIPPTVETALWLIVLVKFLTPIGPASPFSMAGLIERASNYSTKTALGVAPIELPSMPLGADSPGAESSASASTAVPHSVNWTMIIAAIYLSGALAILFYRIRTYRVMWRSFSELPEADVSTTTLVASVCRRLGVARRPAVRLSDDAAAPFVIGLLKPMLVLSHRHLASPDELETVVVHEVAHLRRGDMLVRLLQWIAGSVLFFWPVVAWVNRRIDMAREHACDQWALRRGKLSAGEYARCLLEAARPLPVRRFAYQPVCMAANPKNIERRIDMILASHGRSSKRPLWGLLTGTLVLGWSAFALSGAAAAKAQEEKPQFRREAQPPSADLPIMSDLSFEMQQRSEYLRARVAEFSNADLDGDGNLSQPERSALMVTIAMQSPNDVLERFPRVDVDGDGRLSVYETIGWIDGHQFQPPLSPGAAANGISQPGEGSEPATYTARMESMGAQLDRYIWILDNAESEPSGKQVAHYVKEIRKSRLAQMRERIPDADLDGDGLLTEEERDTFMQRLRPARLAARAEFRERLLKQRAEAVEYGATDEMLEQLDAAIQKVDETGVDHEGGLIALADEGAAMSKPGSLDARTVLWAAKRVALNPEQKDDIRDLERETIGVYRKISRKDKEVHTKLAEQVKAEITKLLDAEQKEQFEAALKRLDRGKVKRDRKSRKP